MVVYAGEQGEVSFMGCFNHLQFLGHSVKCALWMLPRSQHSFKYLNVTVSRESAWPSLAIGKSIIV